MNINLKAIIDIYNGDEWENLCGQLLKIKYGDNSVTKISADLGGDGGLDYLVTSGLVYQCYAPEDEYEAEK
jgi:hypothetical protein